MCIRDRDKGKKNGVLTYQEILDEVENIDLSPEQIEKIYEVLESMGIEVQGAANDVDIIEEEIDLSCLLYTSDMI